MDPLQILGRLGTENPPTDAELAAAETALLDALDAATSSAASAEDLAVAKDLRSALDAVRAETTTRAEAVEAARQEAAALREGLFEDKAPEADAEGEEAPAEEAPAPEPVAASPTDLLNRLTAHAKKLPAPEVKEPKQPGAKVRAIGTAAGFDLKADAEFQDLGQLFSTHAKSITSSGASQPLVRLERSYDVERTLGSNVDLNNRRLANAYGTGTMTQQAISAAGGLCGPGDVDHSHPICSDRGRPVRDSLMQFNASRGRLQFAPSASLGDMSPNVSIWTSQMDSDAASGAGTTKPCPRIECPEELSESVDAVVKCITVGNFQAQFSPEFWASRLELAMVAHDRLAEQKAIAEIHDASTLLTDIAPSGGNTLQNFLTTVNTVIAADRQINRNLSGQYVVLTDSYLRDAIRNQFITNLGVANNVEALQIADSEIQGWLGDVNATGVWTQDGTIDVETDLNRVLTPGVMPTESTVYIYPREAFLFLDGGTLDLGTSITDSTLNAVNDRQAFAETFEKVAFRGCSSYAVEVGIQSFCGCA